MRLRGRPRRAGAWGVLAGCACLGMLALAAPGARTARAAGGFPGAHRSSMGMPMHGRPLPDSVLATVGDGRIVGAAAFGRQWAAVSPPARPDSLDAAGARRFLDLLVDKEVLAERAVRERYAWTPSESTQVANLGDRLVMRVALDSALAGLVRERLARGEPPLEPEPLGVALRETTVARLRIVCDAPLLERLAQAFAALSPPSADAALAARAGAGAPLPSFAADDLPREVAQSEVGPYRVAEMRDAWARLDPLYRPRVETADQVRDLVKNGLFQRALRREAERRHLDRHPRVLETLARQREYLAVESYVNHEVFAHIPNDSVTLRREYDRDPSAWTLPARFRVVMLVLPGKPEATRMALTLRDAAQADSLVARGLRQGVDYRAQITAADDSALFSAARRSGTDAVLGPDSTAGGWQVARVGAFSAPRPRGFDEVEAEVAQRWTDAEGERRLVILMASLRRKTRIVVNERGLERLVRLGLPTAAGPGH